MFTLDCDRAYLYAHPERELTADETQRYDDALARRATGVPAQYITGHQEFWGMDLIVSPAVLIPRPETEHLIEAVLDLIPSAFLHEQNQSQRPRTGMSAPHGLPSTPFRIVDVGTGSGAIALALAKEFPAAEIHATDISSAALEVARANAGRHELAARIQFHETDLLTGLGSERFDFVISNPPYVGESEKDSVQLEVRKFEPHNAVFAGPSGLEIIERLIPQAHDALVPEGWLVLEMSGTIADSVRALLAGWDQISIRKDLQGIGRVAVARKAAKG